MSAIQRALDWLDGQQAAMEETVMEWSRINTGTFHRTGLDHQCMLLERAFSGLGDSLFRRRTSPVTRIDGQGRETFDPLGDCLVVEKRSEAPLRVLLAIHMDTVYPPDSPFQTPRKIDDNTLCGPGVADAKGGLVVMLFALQAFERFVDATGRSGVGWTVLINADEEIGSPGSHPLFAELSDHVDLGLLFEPAFADGGLVSSRKGSGNFSIVVRGRAAHVGRDFHVGRNAIVVAAELATELNRLNGRWPEMSLNVARIDGGGPSNMVPEVAVVRLNVRYVDAAHEPEILQVLETLVATHGLREGIRTELHGSISSPPKVLDDRLKQMLEHIRACGRELALDLRWQPTGGACDGNRLAAVGVTNVDTLGVRGGNLHSSDEFLLLDSLRERARLTALYLMRLAEEPQFPVYAVRTRPERVMDNGDMRPNGES